MIRNFNNQEEASYWISSHAISREHQQILESDLNFNHQFTGRYFVFAILSNQESSMHKGIA